MPHSGWRPPIPGRTELCSGRRDRQSAIVAASSARTNGAQYVACRHGPRVHAAPKPGERYTQRFRAEADDRIRMVLEASRFLAIKPARFLSSGARLFDQTEIGMRPTLSSH